MARRRLDSELVARGLVDDVTEARKLIIDNRVTISGAPVGNPSSLVSARDELGVLSVRRFASRGGDKLNGALDRFEIGVSGLHCLDAGTGSGGFTDCLLQRGARSIIAVDVGYGQFDWKLRNDPRVHLCERTNLRTADPDLLVSEGGLFDLVAADLSFVSLRLFARILTEVSRPEASIVLLVKPQFEAARHECRGGVVSDPVVWDRVVHEVAEEFAKSGWGTAGAVASGLIGPEGNREFFLWLRQDAKGDIIDAIGKAVEEAP